MSEEPTPEEMKEEEHRLEPLEVIVKNQPKEKEEKNPTSYDTKDEWDFVPSEEEQKEMTDAT